MFPLSPSAMGRQVLAAFEPLIMRIFQFGYLAVKLLLLSPVSEGQVVDYISNTETVTHLRSCMVLCERMRDHFSWKTEKTEFRVTRRCTFYHPIWHILYTIPRYGRLEFVIAIILFFSRKEHVLRM